MPLEYFSHNHTTLLLILAYESITYEVCDNRGIESKWLNEDFTKEWLNFLDIHKKTFY